MKRAGIAALVLFAAAAMAQVHGVPASVTSQTSKGFTPGVPASVTSLGPNGWQDGRGYPFGVPPSTPPTTFSCIAGGLACYPTTYPPVHSGVKGGHHRRSLYGYGGYAYAPYYYPAYPAYSTDYMSGYDYLQPAPTAEEPAPPAPTIFERRPASRPYARDEARYEEEYRGPAAEATPKSTVIGVGEQETTTLVFADGHQLDIHNYAIVGQILFNLDGTGPFKVKLAELDLVATAKINEDRGVDFKLPR
ncbi:MAG TPA: hypothetical protein VMS96_12515 [Terriglobales bacterium]|nr:hypothetical protein [Terriglobales bacterium]